MLCNVVFAALVTVQNQSNKRSEICVIKYEETTRYHDNTLPWQQVAVYTSARVLHLMEEYIVSTIVHCASRLQSRIYTIQCTSILTFIRGE